MNKKAMWEVKKNSRFLSTGHRILPSCGCKARETMVAKYELVSPVDYIHLIGPLEQYLAENISLQRSNCIIFGLTDIVALFANEARFFRFRVFFQACSLLNEVGVTPYFFYISDKTNSSTLSGKSLRKKSMLEFFRANVLKCFEIQLPNEKTKSCVKAWP